MKFLLTLTLIFAVTACTVHLQNTSTNGKATDVIDDEMSPDNKVDVSPTLQIPGVL